MKECKHPFQVVFSVKFKYCLQYCRNCKKVIDKWAIAGDAELKITEADSESIKRYEDGKIA